MESKNFDYHYKGYDDLIEKLQSGFKSEPAIRIEKAYEEDNSSTPTKRTDKIRIACVNPYINIPHSIYQDLHGEFKSLYNAGNEGVNITYIDDDCWIDIDFDENHIDKKLAILEKWLPDFSKSGLRQEILAEKNNIPTLFEKIPDKEWGYYYDLEVDMPQPTPLIDRSTYRKKVEAHAQVRFIKALKIFLEDVKNHISKDCYNLLNDAKELSNLKNKGFSFVESQYAINEIDSIYTGNLTLSTDDKNFLLTGRQIIVKHRNNLELLDQFIDAQRPKKTIVKQTYEKQITTEKYGEIQEYETAEFIVQFVPDHKKHDPLLYPLAIQFKNEALYGIFKNYLEKSTYKPRSKGEPEQCLASFLEFDEQNYYCYFTSQKLFTREVFRKFFIEIGVQDWPKKFCETEYFIGLLQGVDKNDRDEEDLDLRNVGGGNIHVTAESITEMQGWAKNRKANDPDMIDVIIIDSKNKPSRDLPEELVPTTPPLSPKLFSDKNNVIPEETSHRKNSSSEITLMSSEIPDDVKQNAMPNTPKPDLVNEDPVDLGLAHQGEHNTTKEKIGISSDRENSFSPICFILPENLTISAQSLNIRTKLTQFETLLNKENSAEAQVVAKATQTLINQTLGQLVGKPPFNINNDAFEKAVKAYEETVINLSLKQKLLIGAMTFLGALVGFVIGAVVGAAISGLNPIAAVVAGATGAIAGAAIGTTMVGGASFGLARFGVFKCDPIKKEATELLNLICKHTHAMQ